MELCYVCSTYIGIHIATSFEYAHRVLKLICGWRITLPRIRIDAPGGSCYVTYDHCVQLGYVNQPAS